VLSYKLEVGMASPLADQGLARVIIPKDAVQFTSFR
jgi:hypothetical protein